MRNEKGITTLQILLITPFVLYFFLCVVTSIQMFVTKTVIDRAAREAQRALSIYHDQAVARNMAVEIINDLLPPGTMSAPGITMPHQAFDPVNPNDPDGRPDVYFFDDGSICESHVRYHVVTIAPGMAKLMNPSQPMLGKYITLHSVDRGHREYVPSH